jgi:hypothetical protein
VLPDVFWANDGTRKIIQGKLKALGVESSKKQSAQMFVQDHKVSLIDGLFGHQGFRKVSLQDQTDLKTKFKLKGTVCTNGLVINALAYDTTAFRRKTAAKEMTGQGTEDNEDIEQDVDNNDDFERQDFEESSEIDDAFFDPSDNPSDDPQTDNNPTTAPSIYRGSIINWRQGSKTLDNVEMRFSEASVSASPDDTMIIGIDPGETNAITAALIDPRKPNTRHVVKVKRSFLYGPNIQFRNALQSKKDKAGVSDIERDIPSFSRATLPEYFRYLTASSGEFPTVLERILAFYSENWYSKKKWDSQKAATACMDFAIKSILNMAGATEGERKDEYGRPVVFCVGLGTFNTQSGLTSKHSAVLKRFITRVCLARSDKS